MSLTDSDTDLLRRIAAKVANPKPPVIEAEADLDTASVQDCSAAQSSEWKLPGFGPKSRILTSFGAVPMEALRRRDPIMTFDNRFLEVEYVDEIRLDRRFLINHPEAQPVHIPAGSLGSLAPKADMFVSGGQELRLMDRTDSDHGTRADEMIGRAGIMRKSHGYFTYYTFHCGEPCIVNVDGAWCHVGPTEVGVAA